MLDNLTVDALNEFSYFAETAGLELRLGNSPVGFEIGVFGLNEKLLVLLDKILETLRDTVFSADRFSLIEEQVCGCPGCDPPPSTQRGEERGEEIPTLLMVIFFVLCCFCHPDRMCHSVCASTRTS